MVDVDTSSYADPGVNKLLAAAGNDPTAALQQAGAAQGLAMNAQVMQLRQAQLSQQQLDLGKSKLNALNQVFGALVANPTQDNFGTQLTEAVKQGVIDPDTAQRAATQVMGFGGDPAKIKAWATDHLNQNAQHQQLMDQAYGTPGMLSDGASSTPIVTKQGAGAGIYRAAGPTVQQQLPPEVSTAPQQGQINPDGSPTQTTRGQAVQRQGGLPATVDPFGRIAYPGRAAPPAAATPPAPAPAAATPPAQPPAGQGAPQGAAPPAPVSPAPGAFSPSGAPIAGARMSNTIPGSTAPVPTVPAAPAAPPAQPPGRQPPPASAPPVAPPAAAPAQPGPITVGLPPGVAEGKSAMAAAGAKSAADLQAAADTVPQQNAAIDNLSAQLGKISTGPLASKIYLGKATYNQVAQMSGILKPIDPDGVASYEEFHKSAAQLAGASMAALGGAGTNDKLGLALAQNPNDTLSNMGNAQVIALLKGLNAAVTVKNEAQQAYLQAHGGDPSSIGAFQADWNKTFSPRAFQFAYMSPEQRSTLFASMSPAERKQLVGAVQTAEQRGWIKSGI